MNNEKLEAGLASDLNNELGFCSSCKYWCRNKNDYGHYSSEAYNLGLGQCMQAKMLFDCVQWDRDGERTIFCKYAGDTKAFVQDGSDYKAWLLTKKDFGCVSWRAKT